MRLVGDIQSDLDLLDCVKILLVGIFEVKDEVWVCSEAEEWIPWPCGPLPLPGSASSGIFKASFLFLDSDCLKILNEWTAFHRAIPHQL